MIARPYLKASFSFTLILLILGCVRFGAFGQCGVYLRPVLTQRIPYDKLYLDRAADLTGDGKTDLLASQQSSSFSRTKLFIIPNNGNGTFGTPIVINPPSGLLFSDDWTVGQVNGDSLNDIIAYQDSGSAPPTTMWIFMNNGNGTFAPPVISNVSGRGHLFPLVDINGDGIRDYVGFNNSLRYGLGNGDGTFGPMVTISSNDGGASAGDFNADGRADFINTRNLYMNNGDGTFTASSLSGVIDVSSGIYSVQDLNGDGRSDVVGGGSGGFKVHKKTTTGWDSATYSVPNLPGQEGSTVIGNVIGDASTDLLITYRNVNKKIVYTGDASGNFSAGQEYTGRFGYVNFLTRATADYDGDGRLDIVQMTSKITNSRLQWPEVTSITLFKNVCDRVGQTRINEVDGTGNTDFSFWNPATGDWSYKASPYDNETQAIEVVNWGLGSFGDIPTPGDFDGDGITDRAIFRDSTGVWYVRRSSDQVWYVLAFGLSGDKPVVGDYDGDTISDIAVWRPSDGNWYIWYMGTQTYNIIHFGSDGDKTAQADFDGDYKTDAAVFRPSTGLWYILNSSDLSFRVQPWGVSGDRPMPADYDGDGKADVAIYRESNRFMYVARSYDSSVLYYEVGTTAGDVPQVGDFNGDFVMDIGFYRPSTKLWLTNNGGAVFGVDGGIPTASTFRYE